MTYEEIKEKYPPKSFGEVKVKGSIEKIDNKKYTDDNWRCTGWEVYLEHSCGEWVIGDKDNAKHMAECLLLAVKYIEDNS